MRCWDISFHLTNQQNTAICTAHKRLKYCHEICFESGRYTKWGSLQHSPRPVSWIWVLRQGRGEKGKKRERKERTEKRQTPPEQKIVAMALISTCFIYKSLELPTAS